MRLEFLEADDVGLELAEPAQQHLEPRGDAVDVVAGDSQPPFVHRLIHSFVRVAAVFLAMRAGTTGGRDRSIPVLQIFGCEAWNPGNFGCRGLPHLGIDSFRDRPAERFPAPAFATDRAADICCRWRN